MHELKDEAFVRRRIEFQPMALHTAKVQYRSKSTNSNNPNFPIRESRMNQVFLTLVFSFEYNYSSSTEK